MTKENAHIPTEAEIEKFLSYMKHAVVFLEKDDMALSFFAKLFGQKNNIAPQIIEKKVEIPVEKIVEKRVEVPVEVIVEKIVEKKVAVTPEWAKPLEKQQQFLQQVTAHTELSRILLPEHANDVVQLIATASQWNNVLRIWDALAKQAKDKQTISNVETAILEYCLALYNLTLSTSQAILKKPHVGDDYDFGLHQKISGSGDQVQQVLLAGLYNPAGEKVRSAIVTTY